VKTSDWTDDVPRLAATELCLASGELGGDYFALLVPTFDDPEFDPLQSDDWLPLTLSFGSARIHGSPDRAAIDALMLVVRDKGTEEAPLPLRADFGGLHATPSPASGVVSLTFYDGYDEHFDVAARAHGERGVEGLRRASGGAAVTPVLP
jgi:hypothetical protein